MTTQLLPLVFSCSLQQVADDKRRVAARLTKYNHTAKNGRVESGSGSQAGRGVHRQRSTLKARTTPPGGTITKR